MQEAGCYLDAFITRVPHNVLQDEEAVLLRIKLAQKLGVLSCSECSLAMLPALLTADEQALAAVQVRRPPSVGLQNLQTSVPADHPLPTIQAMYGHGAVQSCAGRQAPTCSVATAGLRSMT
jgi:hypothetical protein